ncbi:hypothetical protein D9M71_720780 [compost metagenome]
MSIHGIRLPASGTPKCSDGMASLRMASATLRSMSRMALDGLARSSATEALMAPICLISSRMFCAPAPEAAW